MTSDAEKRQRQALELHLAGATYDEIARQLEYASRSGAYKAVQKALEERRAPDSTPADAKPAETELARLDAMLQGLWPKARKGDVAAVDRVLLIEQRREKLLQQAAPQKGSTRDQLAERRAARKTAAARKPRAARTPKT